MKPAGTNPSQWNPRPRPRPAPPDLTRRHGFRIRLLCPGAASSRRSLAHLSVSDIIRSLPSSPDQYFMNSTGPFAADLLFCQCCDAFAAVSHLWALRLGGTHRLVPVLESSFSVPSDKTEMEARLRSLFADHARRLLECDSVRRWKSRVEEITEEISKISFRLKKLSQIRVYEELSARRKRLSVEKQQVKCRLSEFVAAVRCVLAYLGEPDERGVVQEQENQTGFVEVFRFGKEPDWCRIQAVLERERKRLDEGLPIYACRRDILRTIQFNQVTVLIGETGSGKSTQLVQFLADSGLAADGSIVCTQPRKIAAISLGRRVAEESNGCYSDDLVVYYSTYYSSQLSDSKVIYMTDYCLLQHCLNNMSLTGISYIIVDEAHERSLNTDLLLAIVKKQLLERFDLRLIIMSATADADKLAKYFYGCCIFNVMGRNFPVEIKYVTDVASEASTSAHVKHTPSGCAPYVADVLKMVRVIHSSEEGGAILAFLTSQMEVEWACENFHEPNAAAFPLHGKLSCEEQNRIFESYPGRRKVIFSTNVAETSLTIQDVKYVVDSGMVKESRFEPNSGMNVLKVCWVSQSSAKQRAGRAGRTGPGKCYRLYSENDFQSMEIHQEPEIRKVHLAIAVLRILALGIQNIQDFEFIDAPSPEAIDTAVQDLVHLGAVTCRNDAYELTDVGRYLTKLGIEPRLGKIILDCFSCGLRKEGLVLASVMTHASSIFCRVGSEEEKCRADRLKLPFCHRDGDLFTLLSVYKQWEDNHKSRNKWCWQNSINAKSMRRCEDTAMELENCLWHELNTIVPSYWLWNSTEPTVHDKHLKRIILSSLAKNVAMFSGYDRLGYEVALTGQNLQVHPSCSLLAYGKKPDWVVFGEIISLPTQYLVCVTAVEYECLYKIQPSLFDLSLLECRKMQMSIISIGGNNLLRRLCGKLNYGLGYIVSHLRTICMDGRISIDVDFEKGELQLFASAKDMEKACSFVGNALHCERRWLRDECMEKRLYHTGAGNSASVALFGSGAEIKHLELEKRFLAVEISHANAHVLGDKELLMIVDQFAPGIANFHKHAGNLQEIVDLNTWGKIVFLTPEAAENAVAKLNKVEMHGSMLKVVPVSTDEHLTLPFPAVKARLSWPRRMSKGVALVKCAAEDADSIINDCSGLEIGGSFIHCDVSIKHDNCIFVTGIPRDVSDSEFNVVFRRATSRRILDIHLLRGQPVTDTPSATYAEALVKEISSFMPKNQFQVDNFRIEVFKPEMKDYMVKALITFNGNLHLEAAKALDHIQGKVLPCCLSWQKIECQQMFYSSLSCSGRVYFAVRKELEALLHHFESQTGVSCKLDRTVNGTFRVKIYANATKVVADIRKPLEQLMKGKPLSHPSLTLSVMQALLSRDGLALMKIVERDTRTCILFDRQKLNAKVFGPPEQVVEAELKLIESLLSLHESKQLEICLRGCNLPPGLMKEVVQRFGPDLQGLKEKIPGVELVLNTRHHILSIKGTKEMKKMVEETVSEVIHSMDNEGRIVEQLSEESVCPICLCELEDSYKLEACGHDFCRACLVDQFESVIRSHDGFPICCANEGCKEPILLVDLRFLLSSEKLEEVFRTSLSAFVATSSGTYRFCPTPDCPCIYRVAPNEAAAGSFICPACSAETCTMCHLEYHPFISCERYKDFKEDPDLSLLAWRHGKAEVKDCPSCSHTIEKTEGCNHIECRCGQHLCWVCLECFDSSDKCYSHLRSEHHAIV